jgi:hypothetical protein
MENHLQFPPGQRTMYKVLCSHCDEQYEITMEERDILDDDAFVCDACFKNPPEHTLEINQCRCKVSYGMTKSSSGPGYFQDSNPGVITDTSCCSLHRIKS